MKTLDEVRTEYFDIKKQYDNDVAKRRILHKRGISLSFLSAGIFGAIFFAYSLSQSVDSSLWDTIMLIFACLVLSAVFGFLFFLGFSSIVEKKYEKNSRDARFALVTKALYLMEEETGLRLSLPGVEEALFYEFGGIPVSYEDLEKGTKGRIVIDFIMETGEVKTGKSYEFELTDVEKTRINNEVADIVSKDSLVLSHEEQETITNNAHYVIDNMRTLSSDENTENFDHMQQALLSIINTVNKKDSSS